MPNYEVKKKLSCDVAIVGGGNAGLVAAIEAKNAGAHVLIIEKAVKKLRGGNSRFSGGFFRTAFEEGGKDLLPLVAGTPLPEGELEIQPYTKDAFYNKVMVLSEGLADKTFTEIYVERSLETAKWMREQGVIFDINPCQIFQKEDHLVCPSGGTMLEAKGAGEGLVEMLYGIVEKKGIEVLYETAGCSLIQDSGGKVVGLIVRDRDGFMEIEAKNVILACGGHQASPDARRKYLGENWDLVKLRGTRYDTGDGIKMAVDIGAQTAGHWGGCHASMVSEDSPMIEAAGAGSERYSYPYSVMVNRDAKRFVDEGRDFQQFTYAKYGKEILKQPGAVAFQIYDSKIFPLFRVEYQEAVRVESNTLEELAEALEIDKEQFVKTIAEYNQAVQEDVPFAAYKLDGRRTRGLNPDKTNWAQKIDTPPYRAYAVVCGLTMTYGGLKTNTKTQVINTADQPIKGLYAVGEVTGGFFYHNYPSGTGLTRGAAMARIAGAEAAANR
jgi:tricarballylate dehydrogenase